MLENTTSTNNAHIPQKIPLSVPSCAAKVKIAAAPSKLSTGLEFIMVSSEQAALVQYLYPDVALVHALYVHALLWFRASVAEDHDAGHDRSRRRLFSG